jgi:hypothetical protein
MLVALVACRDPDAPRPVNVLPSPPPDEVGTRPLTSRDEPARDVRPVAPTPPAAPALSPGVPDPAEPGIPDLARLARYVFREMRGGQDACPFVNPLRDPIAFAVHVEVQEGRMTEVHLAWAAVRHGGEAHRLEPPPPELSSYAECLAPRLRAVVMDPPPADGAYQPEYSYPGKPGGR